MLADRPRPPLRGVISTLGAMLAVMLVCQRDRARAHEGDWPGLVEIHVKLRTEAAAMAMVGSHDATRIDPLFTQRASSHDVRSRWLRITTTTTRTGDEVLRALLADPAVETAFLTPEITLPSARGTSRAGAARSPRSTMAICRRARAPIVTTQVSSRGPRARRRSSPARRCSSRGSREGRVRHCPPQRSVI